jgi:hypothetical protein
VDTMRAVQNKLNPFRDPNTFELFGEHHRFATGSCPLAPLVSLCLHSLSSHHISPFSASLLFRSLQAMIF